MLVTGFIDLAYKEISSCDKRQKASQRVFIAMEKHINLEWNKIFHVEDSMVMYGIYNVETIEKLQSPGFYSVRALHNS